MNLGTEIQFNFVYFIGFMLESISYGKHRPTTAFGSDTNLYGRSYIGTYCVIYAAFVRMRLKRTNNAKALLYLITANFIACTAHLAVNVTTSQTNASLGEYFAVDALYICNDLILQIILVSFRTYDSASTNDASGIPFSIKIYRCWIMWRQRWVMVVPILLTLAFLGASLHNLNWDFQANVHLVVSVTTLANFPSINADPSPAVIELYFSLVLSIFSLSLSENALVTGLLIFKILTVYRDIQGLESRVGYANGPGRDMLRIISILIESSVITFMAQLVQTLMFKFDNDAYRIIGGLVAQINVRDFTVNC